MTKQADAKAIAVLAIGPVAVNQLHNHGLEVVDAKRLSALERLYRAHKRMRQSSRDMRTQARYLYAGQAWMQAAEDADKAVRELEVLDAQ